jgi:hypothetical protein
MMIQTVLRADLGRLCVPRRPPGDDIRHRLLFVASHRAVVMPYARAGGRRWLCLVVAARDVGNRRPGHLALAEDEVCAAPGELVVDVNDHDGLALLLWPARVFLRWPGGALIVLARVLVEELRQPGTLHIPGEAVADHGRLATRLPIIRPPGVGRMLDRLHHAGLLNPDPAGGLTLTIPAAPTGEGRKA